MSDAVLEHKAAMYSEKEISHLEQTDSQDDAHHRNIVGQDAKELQGYWASWRLIGSMLAIALMGNSLFVGYAMPVSKNH